MKRKGTPTLPGERRGRRPRVAADPVHNPGRRSTDRLRQAILDALVDGPIPKWRLREQLHEPEQVVYTALRALRAEGLVKVVGRRLLDRSWALTAYVPAPVVRVPSATTAKAPEPPARDSWWAKPFKNRDDFADAQQDRWHRPDPVAH